MQMKKQAEKSKKLKFETYPKKCKISKWENAYQNFTFSHYFLPETGKVQLYIDGEPSGDQQSLSINNLNGLNQLHFGFARIKETSGDRCDCDLFEFEMYKVALSQDQIYNSYSKFVKGDDCP